MTQAWIKQFSEWVQKLIKATQDGMGTDEGKASGNHRGSGEPRDMAAGQRDAEDLGTGT